jgi:uncharacterized ion transporter superfamily protein YfcC
MLKKLPSSFTILFIFIVFVAVLSWIVPAGTYNTVLNTNLAKAVQVPVPNTYHLIEAHKQGLTDIFMAPIAGFYDPITGQARAIGITLFIIFIGGFFGVVNATGAINTAIKHTMHKLKGHEAWIIPILMFLFAMGGSLIGMAEDTLPFYVILIPIMLAAGFDTVTSVAIILLGSSMGNIGSTINPFSTIIASNAGNIPLTQGLFLRITILTIGWLICVTYTLIYATRVKRDPSKSLVYGLKVHDDFLVNLSTTHMHLKFIDWLVLINFMITFVVMIWGVISKGWWMEQMSALVLFQSITTAFIYRMKEQDFIEHFINGAKDLLGVALIIGLANGIVAMMNNAGITYTFLHWAELALHNMSQLGFVYAIFFIEAFLSLFVPSSSGLAVLTMPIMVPLANFADVPGDLVVTSYQTANGIINLINPVYAVTAGSLMIAKVPFSAWVKFIWPLVLILSGLVLLTLFGSLM